MKFSIFTAEKIYIILIAWAGFRNAYLQSFAQ